MPAELRARGSPAAEKHGGEGKGCDPQLQPLLSVGMVRNKTRWVFYDPLETVSSGQAFVRVLLRASAVSALQNAVRCFSQGGPCYLWLPGHVFMLVVIFCLLLF